MNGSIVGPYAKIKHRVSSVSTDRRFPRQSNTLTSGAGTCATPHGMQEDDLKHIISTPPPAKAMLHMIFKGMHSTLVQADSPVVVVAMNSTHNLKFWQA